MPDKIHMNCVREKINLPNEILAIIFNKLALDAEENNRTLAALASCRLASQVLCSLATPLFFSSIQLTEKSLANPNDRLVAFNERATKLNQILTTCDVAGSVQTFTLHCNKINLENSINSTLISAILRRLPYIRNLTLETEGEFLDFSSITEDCTSAIQAFGTSPKLSTLSLGNIVGFPITVITACPNLRCLRLSRVEFCFDNMHSMDEIPMQFFHLDSLEIDGISTYSLGLGISDDTSLAGYFSRIRNLRIKDLFLDDTSLMHGWDIIFLASRSLTTLDLPVDVDLLQLEVHPFDLSWFPALRHFKIQLPVSSPGNTILLSFLSVLLSIPSSTSCIETLEIKITWDGVEDGKDLFSSDAGWAVLDEILASEKFASLRKVVLDLCIEMETETVACHNDDYHRNLELEKNLILPYINALFPMFTASTNNERTLGIHVEII